MPCKIDDTESQPPINRLNSNSARLQLQHRISLDINRISGYAGPGVVDTLTITYWIFTKIGKVGGMI